MKKGKMYQFRISSEELGQMTQQAKLRGFNTLSAYILYLLRNDTGNALLGAPASYDSEAIR
jgi:hypothetical protein